MAGAALAHRGGASAFLRTVTDPLAQWKTSLSSVGSAPASVVAIGASFVEGQGASVRQNVRWLDRFRSTLQANHPSGAAGGYGYQPAFYATYGPDSTWAAWQTASSGTVTNDSSVPSLGFRTAIMSAGAVRTYTFTGTDLDIWYAKRSDAGSFTWAIDGGSTTSVSGTGTASVANRVQITGLSAASHTVTITATGKTYLEGFSAYNGDRAKGIQVTDSGHSGASTTNFTGLDSTFDALLNTLSPDLIIVTDTSLNDATNGDSVSTVSANTQALLTRLKALTKAPSLLLIADYQPSTMSSAPSAWSAYVAALSSLAASNGATFLDLTAVMPTATTAGTGLYRTDGLHPNDSGHNVLAGWVANALGEMYATVAPAVTGSTTVGSVLTASTGTWVVTPDSYTYQWTRNGTPISGATSSTYTLVSGDVGTTVACTVTATKSGYVSGLSTPSVSIAAGALFSENFPGAAGSAWPSGWTTFTGGTGSSVQQTGANAGRLTTSSTAYTLHAVAYRNDVLAADWDVTFDLAFASIVEQYLDVGIRMTTPTGAPFTPAGYYIQFFPGAGVNSGGVLKTGDTIVSGDLAFGQFTANTYKRFRFKVQGSTLQVKVWDPAGAEPGTWLWTGTDTSVTGTGRFVVAEATGGLGNVLQTLFKNISAI